MSVIIRLQNLPWSANALDIRQFFHGLSIPEGGVHIVGGELGDAFIAFSTDEDARQAFNRNGGKIKEVQIKLMLSSRTEMQKVIEAARNPLAAFMQAAQPTPTLPPIIPSVVPAAVPEVKKEDLREKDKDKDKRGRRRSRSRSRERKDRSRDRDRRRRRDRSRSRSRDRRDRRRRERSRSRDRTRSKDRDRRSKDYRRSEDKAPGSFNAMRDSKNTGIWEPPPVHSEQSGIPPNQQSAPLLNNYMGNTLEDSRRTMSSMKPSNSLAERNEYPGNTSMMIPRNRESWPPNGPLRPDNRMDFASRHSRSINSDEDHMGPTTGGRPNFNTRFDGNPPNRMLANRTDSRPSRFNHNGPGDRSQNMPLQNSCVQLRPFYGGYGEVRRFFQGLFINNTGIKFVNDDYGKRTGIVYIRFFYPEDKEQALLKDGGVMRGNVVEVKHLDDEIFNETVDRYLPDEQKDSDQSHQMQSQNYRGGRAARSFPRGSQQHKQAPPVPKVYSCLVVEDLPNYAKEQDILKMFGEYPLMSILMVNRQRRPFAYVKFSNADDAKKAQSEKPKQVIDGKAVTVRPCADEEFEEINREQNDPGDDDDVQIVEEKPFPNIDSNCISISGLPLKTTDRDIIDFFSDIGVTPEKIHLLNNHLGFTGTAYCEFSSLQDAAAALEKDGIPLGPKEVSILSVPKEEMESRLGILAQGAPPVTSHTPNGPQSTPFHPRSNFGPRGHGGMGPRAPMRRFHPPQLLPPVQHGGDVGVPGCTVLMENVPYKAGLDEILDFFDGFNIPPDNVLRRYNENGTPSGEAKVIFNSSDEAYKAIEQKKFHKIRERTIYLTLC